MTDVPSALASALADRYALERELGHGGMATVYLARDVRHGRQVAVKVLRAELAAALGGDRFLREVAIAAQLQSPHILPLLDSGSADGLLYYVMPYVAGDSLRDRLVKHGAIAPSEVTRLLRDVVDALAHAHRHGVVHRDIKPDNVMIADRHALVMDFGVAKAMTEASGHHALTSIGISLGTPAYMAPEQAAADPAIDGRADIYSVGVVAYEMLTGAPPFTGAPQAVIAAHISTPPVPLLEVRPDVPPAIAQLVMRCLEKDPARRFRDADELLATLESLTSGAHVPAAMPARRRAARWLAPAAVLAVVVVALAGTAALRRDRWVHRTALPELRRLAEAAEQDSAWALAREIAAAAPDDSALAELWPRFARKAVLRTTPEGVRVYRASFADSAAWEYIGTTPTDSVWLPARVGYFRLEKPGFRTIVTLAGSRPPAFTLDAEGAPHAEMARIPGDAEVRAFLVGTDGAPPIPLGDFLMDRFEVTNREYKAFVDAGGYRDRQWWEHDVRDGARALTWEQAMARFVDRTGRPGPASWQGGTFPDGQESHPVGGVSWYEAAAYAKYAGKQLPTLYHWARGATVNYARWVVPYSNLEGKGPLPVGARRGISLGGVSDLAGNVREWVVNDAGRGQRYILGGGWRDPSYGFVDAYAQLPIDRSEINGIRLMLPGSDTVGLARAAAPIPRAFTDFSRVTPVSDAVFAGFRPLFEYDPRALDARVESRDTTNADWILERVSYTAAYGGERMFAWLYLPKRGTPPFQTVVYFPGSGVIGAGSSMERREQAATFVVQNGRALLFPVYKSTYERSDSLRSDIANESVFWRDHVVMWVKDFRRTLDYAATRADLDSARIAYFGVSWGGYMGGIIPAVEPRIKASVLLVAGLTMERGRPEVEPVNYLPRIRIPTLMLNGHHDFFFPLETSQRHFFRFLGTPAADKRHMVYEGGHDVPRTQLIAESLAWLDRYLGPVK